MDEEKYLSVLSGQTDIAGVLTPDDILTIQSKLWVLLGKRTDSYTMGDSSSVRIETAQELLKSACFIIGMSFDTSGDSEAIKKCLISENFDDLFKTGFKEVQSRVKTGKELYQKAVDSAPKVENYCYKNTLREIQAFFKLYDIYNFAHDIPCMIDYPLALGVSEALQGIVYINDYLSRLIIENEFCGRFEAETVTALLKGITLEYADSHMNIYESVAANALALTLLKSDVYLLDITSNDREKLLTLFSSWQESETISMLQASAAELCSCLDIADSAAIDYLTNTIATLEPRLKKSMKTKKLDILFPSLYCEPANKKPAATYIDDAVMDDEKLRILIDEISSCRHVSDKIALAKQNVHSLRDYAEILSICFWGDECDALFDSLEKDELDLLRRYVRHHQNKFPEWYSETGWETRLTEYIYKQK